MDSPPLQRWTPSRLGDVTWHSARSPCPLQCHKPALPGILKSEAGISENLHRRSGKTLRFNLDSHNVEPAPTATKTAGVLGSVVGTKESAPSTTESTDDKGSSRDSDTARSSSVEVENKDEDRTYYSALSSQPSSSQAPSGSRSGSLSSESSSGGSSSDSSGPRVEALKSNSSGSRLGIDTKATGWVLDSIRHVYAKAASSASSYFSAVSCDGRLSDDKSCSAQPQRADWFGTYSRGAVLALLGGLLLLLIVLAAMANALLSHLRQEDRSLLNRDTTPVLIRMAEENLVDLNIQKPIKGDSGKQPGRDVRSAGGYGGTEGAERLSEAEKFPHVTKRQDETTGLDPSGSLSEIPPESPEDGGGETTPVDVERVDGGLRSNASPFPSRQKVNPGLNVITILNESITNLERMRSDSPKVAR